MDGHGGSGVGTKEASLHEPLHPRQRALVGAGCACILARFLRRAPRAGSARARSKLAGIRMELFVQFVLAKWYLFTAFAVLLALLLAHENRKGGPSLSPAQLTDMVNREDAVVLDLRESGEYRQGHIVSSINMPFAKLGSASPSSTATARARSWWCARWGHHSGAVAKTLKDKGFERVYRLGGGMSEWQASQLPTVRS
jgi:rhodanese-related sulfurtransferase